ncbi:DUF7281 domain-containing protein [Alishewanella tabrizica]|uniref:DUF7281 domain-containing protein n=1 Tax=Alishewanella tabrizica TaxID=671278 RepID=A0ABQ2WMW9_9ALTE|nr:Wadjet anti-phage system protein JetD domain-containing protein [Alishewanella tabrizica]GGW61322.1 hypothetical protein GCM10008111_16860 [Alishewanella tabrizica]
MHYPPLSAQALRYLQQLQQRLNASGSERVKTSGKAVQELLHWCLEHELVPANSLQLPQFRFNLPLLQAIAATQRQLQQACFLDATQQQSRLDNALNSQQELKSLGPSPRQQRVLVRLNNALPCQGLPAIRITDVDWQQIALSAYDALLVVENLDCFYQLERFQLAIPYQQPLLIYRGDKLYGKGYKALKIACLRENKPIVYFGDFDAKGVSIAISEDYSAMLLPDLTTLQHHASNDMLPDKQLSFIAGIATYQVTAAFSPYQQLLCQQLVGLRQQNMQAMHLKPVSIR